MQTQQLRSRDRRTRPKAELRPGGLLTALGMGALIVAAGLVARPDGVASGAKPARTTEPTAVASGVAPSASASEAPAPTTAATFVATPEASSVPALSRLVAIPIPAGKADPRLLYGASADGQWWAWRDSWSGPGKLHLRGADGTSKDLDLGPVDQLAPQVAAFSPDSKRLAVADGAGALWLVDLATAVPALVAQHGPMDLVFGRSLFFAAGGKLYVQLVGSVEVPIPSRIGVLDVATGDVTLLSDDPWAFAPRPLADGSVSYVHMNEDGSFSVRCLAAGKSTEVANVGFIHGGIDISADGRVAYSDGATTWIVDNAGGNARRLGDGAEPRFATDGRSVVVYRQAGGRSVLLDLAGRELATLVSPFVRPTAGDKEQ